MTSSVVPAMDVSVLVEAGEGGVEADFGALSFWESRARHCIQMCPTFKQCPHFGRHPVTQESPFASSNPFGATQPAMEGGALVPRWPEGIATMCSCHQCDAAPEF